MRVMEQIQTLRSALNDVPRTLLGAEETRVLDGVLSSLDIIERSAADQPVVALVGPTGAGKSYVFNAIVGGDASPEGALRPTTSSIIVAGNPTAISQMQIPEAVIVPQADIGMTLIDMPEWGRSHQEAEDLVTGADLVVMVISPIRYADATVAALWNSLDPSRATVVLNRVATTGDETPDLITSVTDTFGIEPYVIGEGGEDPGAIANHITGLIPVSRSDTVASIMLRTVVAGTRFVVQEVTNAALNIGEVAGVIEDIPDCVADDSEYDVQVSWDGTREAIITRVAIAIRDRDDDIVRGSETELAQRILESIGAWEDDALSSALDAWHERCISTFSDASSVRWRRANAEQLVKRFSWSTAINSGIVAPKRFSRILGTRLNETTSQMRSALEQLICEAHHARVALWQAELDRFGDYQPGPLASAVDAVDTQRVRP